MLLKRQRRSGMPISIPLCGGGVAAIEHCGVLE